MYLRLVEVTVRRDDEAKMETVYSDLIIPVLEETKGCVFAGLLKNLEHTKMYISLTIWDSENSAEEYVSSGRYEINVDQVRPLLEDRSEWKIQLSRDNMIEYTPVSNDLVVRSYPVTDSEKPLTEQVSNENSYLRIISHKVKEGSQNEFTDIYNTEILPDLKHIEGCKYAFLVDNSDNEGEMLSFSIWDSLEHVKRYEEEGEFEDFLSKVSHTLGDLYQWKMALSDNSSTSKTITSQDIGIDKYTLITGKKFNR
ncbi:MAG: antibiotic biosynthesis monooxygenase [Candidatus Halalkalibacterium sp. M3_1C_030]